MDTMLWPIVRTFCDIEETTTRIILMEKKGMEGKG